MMSSDGVLNEDGGGDGYINRGMVMADDQHARPQDRAIRWHNDIDGPMTRNRSVP